MLRAVGHGAAAMGAAVLELTRLEKRHDGVFTIRALHDLLVPINGRAAFV